MKKHILVVVLSVVACSQASWAQTETNIGSTSQASIPHETEVLFDSSASGGYVSFDAKTTNITDGSGASSGAFLLGGRAAWIINSHFALGGAVYHLMNDMQGSSQDYNSEAPTFSNSKLSMTYGGFFGEYSFANWKLFHPSASLLVGVGSAQFAARDTSGSVPGTYDQSNSMFFYVTEPQLNGIVNLSPNIRAGVSLSYRWVHAGSNNESFDESNLNGLTSGVFIQAGMF